ncbi:hypothetical protein [Reyranella sp.]|uniref:hypothetical protein n=1 Tax=Reyranella sp. TaxID=1929291 RepID=UPI003D10E826
MTPFIEAGAASALEWGMFAFTNAVARATRYVIGAEEPALWTVSTGGRIVGSLVRDADGCRLSWFAGADPRLVGYTGPVTSDIETLAAALGRRLGASVELQSLPS